MSGPEYPKPGGPGSNAFGSFAFGVSAFGDIRRIEPDIAIVSQYANSPRLAALVRQMRDALDPTLPMQDFFDKVFNVDTAGDYGLKVWGAIVGVERVLPIVRTSPSFGFAEAGPGAYLGFNTWFSPRTGYFGFSESGQGLPFGQGAYYGGFPEPPFRGVSGGGTYNSPGRITRNFPVDLETYRRMIMAKALANISDGGAPSINRVLMTLFPGRGNAYVREGRETGPYFGFAEAGTAKGFNQAPYNLDTSRSGLILGFAEAGSWQSYGHGTFYVQRPANGMKISYVFEFPLSPVDNAIVLESGIIPTPVGVSAEIVQRY